MNLFCEFKCNNLINEKIVVSKDISLIKNCENSLLLMSFSDCFIRDVNLQNYNKLLYLNISLGTCTVKASYLLYYISPFLTAIKSPISKYIIFIDEDIRYSYRYTKLKYVVYSSFLPNVSKLYYNLMYLFTDMSYSTTEHNSILNTYIIHFSIKGWRPQNEDLTVNTRYICEEERYRYNSPSL